VITQTGWPVPVGETRTSVDDVLIGLRGPVTLELLGLTENDLERARSDADLLDTLRIVHMCSPASGTPRYLGRSWRFPKRTKRISSVSSEQPMIQPGGPTDVRRSSRLSGSPLWAKLFSFDRRPTDESPAGMASGGSNL
jgi:hypothetical protein